MSSIAIYEQDRLMHALLQEWLCSAGYQVRDGDVDLAIVSIYNPKQAGGCTLPAIQAAHPKTPMIALSGQFRGGLSSAGSTAQSLGVAQVIAKPLTRDALLGAVHAMIGPPTIAPAN